MRDLSSADESLMKRIGRAICEFTGSNPDATMMIHKFQLKFVLMSVKLFVSLDWPKREAC